ncbi:MAG: NAD(P)H-hydrate epimerase [Nitrososphaerota archaeon]|nr:NAD(P)H-hydrate epimerase [Candidatus Calditenuaceae archaeon]MDW8073036.1 NAD(P)H-hydrate epimerase [Nitrososphaerota archaeon]
MQRKEAPSSRRYKSYEIGIVDENSSYLGVDRRLLMENAGAAVARVVAGELSGLNSLNIVVVAGPGNNGGDGFVAARHLAGRVRRLSVILLARPEHIRTPEADSNWKALSRMRSVELHIAPTLSDLLAVEEVIRQADVIIDGIFGTGIRGEIREPFCTAINIINESRARIFSIDVPSGLDPDTGSYILAVKPSVTVTLHGAKPFLDLATGIAGRVYVEPIGAPPDAETVAGPGDLYYAKSRSLRASPAFVTGGGEAAAGALDALRLFDVEPRHIGGLEGLEVKVGETLVSDKALRGEAGRISLVRRASEQGVEDAFNLAKSLGHPVYIVGGWDSISDGRLVKSNWIEPPIDSEYARGVVTSLSAVFLESGAEPIYALGAACYAARRPLREAGPSDKRDYLEALRRLLTGSD